MSMRFWCSCWLWILDGIEKFGCCAEDEWTIDLDAFYALLSWWCHIECGSWFLCLARWSARLVQYLWFTKTRSPSAIGRSGSNLDDVVRQYYQFVSLQWANDSKYCLCLIVCSVTTLSKPQVCELLKSYHVFRTFCLWTYMKVVFDSNRNRTRASDRPQNLDTEGTQVSTQEMSLVYR